MTDTPTKKPGHALAWALFQEAHADAEKGASLTAKWAEEKDARRKDARAILRRLGRQGFDLTPKA